MARLFQHLQREGISFRSRFVARVIWVHLALVAVFGVALPWTRGIEFLDPVMLSAYACLGVLFAPPAAAQAFAADAPSSTLAAAARIGMAVLYGEWMALIIMLAGLLTVYLKIPHVLFAPDLETLAKASALGAAASIALATVAASVTMSVSARVARLSLRVIFLGLLWVFFSYSRWLPDVAGEAAIVSLVVAAAAFLALPFTVRRARPE